MKRGPSNEGHNDSTVSKKSNSGSSADDLQSQFKLQDFSDEGEECQGKIQKLENEMKVPESLEKRKMGKEVFAIDCEMVGVGPPGSGSRGGERRKDTLARVSIVNIQEMCILDEYVKPSEEVTNFRTDRSGITREHLIKGKNFDDVLRKVIELISGNILVGHDLLNDLKVLAIEHPEHLKRDSSVCSPFIPADNKKPSLKSIAMKFLDGYENFQSGQHDSVEDAKVVMKLYKKFQKEWDKNLKEHPIIAIEIEVPRLSLRRIIGKGGSKIKEITQEGKIWNFIEQPTTEDKSRIYLKGQSQTLIDLAVSKIKKLQ